MRNRLFLIISISLFIINNSNSQNEYQINDSTTYEIYTNFKNPSFEETHRIRNVNSKNLELQALHWINCGNPFESAPTLVTHDSFSDDPKEFNIEHEPHEGVAYINMVVRDNKECECVSQRLDTFLLENEVYFFKLSAVMSEDLLSPWNGRISKRSSPYNKPAILSIYGGNDFGQQLELLTNTEAIENTDWEELIISFSPSQNYQYITFSLSHKEYIFIPYNGNMCIDNLSPIYMVINNN